MKTKGLVIFLMTLIFPLFLSAQKSAGIYYISFRLDELLTNDVKVTFNDRKFFSAYSESPIFPEELVDSIKVAIERKMSEKLDAKVICVYRMNKNNKAITTNGLAGELEGMPVNSKGAALKSNEKEIYVRFNVIIKSSGGLTVTLGNNSRSKYKPMVFMQAAAYDAGGKKIFAQKKSVKDFGKLRSIENTSADGSVTVRKSEILYPEDIYQIFLISLSQF